MLLNSKPKTTRIVRVPLWMMAALMLLLAIVPATTALIGLSMGQRQRVVVVYPEGSPNAAASYVPPPTQAGNTLGYSYPATTQTYALTGPSSSIHPGISIPMPDWLDPSKIVPKMISGLTSAITGKDLPLQVPKSVKQNDLANPPPLFTTIMKWLSHTPDFTVSTRGMQFITALQIAAFGILILAITVLAVRYMTGAERNLLGASVGLGLVAIGIGFYPQIWHAFVVTINQFGDGIYNVGLQLRGWRNPALASVPGGIGLRAILVLMQFFALIIVGLIRGLTILMLAVAFLAGPVAIAVRGFGSNPVWAVWFNNVLRASLWPLVWSLEASVFVLFSGTASFIPSVEEALFQPLIQIGLVYAMIKTPSWINTGFAMAQPRVNSAVNSVSTVTNRAAIARHVVAGGAANPALAIGLAAIGVAKTNISAFTGGNRRGTA